MILLICEYPEFKDLGQLAWTNNRMMRIIKKYLPMALERKTLLYSPNPPEWRAHASVTHFKDKLYYLGGYIPRSGRTTDRIDLSMDGEVERYFYYQTMNGNGLKLERFQKDEIFSELHR
ncbi:hypothetical protein WR25_10655 [Diploscapter pachys]|uniref:Uncharacterized protein n=1 Tax=Diploscapter pachys TaxID=2018661 RepID=A0A2A2K9F7_9BILA|nr:hypothetical protein WR25_10655 [Diploscapter pachys]